MTTDTNFPSLKILVVDGEPANRILLEKFFKQSGHSVISAENGQDAIQLFKDEAPDVVIMDVNLPVMSGYEVTTQIKFLSKDHWVPVIIASELTSPEDQIKGLSAGGDDYIIKPINLSILAFKIQAMQRIAAIQNALSYSLQALKNYQEKTEKEIGLAQHMMRQLTRSEDLDNQGIGYLNIPAGAFSGDLVSVVSDGNGLQFVLLADVTGHGLSSALNAIPLVEAFFEFAERGFSIVDLCRGLNSRLNHILPPGYFVAAIIMAINHKNRTIQVWNGGLPSAFFMVSSGEICCQWKSRHLALGILDDSEFDPSTETLSWGMSGQVIMFTDGLIEASSSIGEVFGETRLTKILRQAAEEERLDRVRQNLTVFLSGVVPHDDISLVTIQCK